MKYRFLNFEFDSISLILSKNGENLAIRHNEAKLLALMLSQPERVFSKEEILAEIWQDKVVSEQAVFQNVSHLRGFFGNDAIKTFSKRGYQWQLELQENLNNHFPRKADINKKETKQYKPLKLVYASILTLTLVFIIFFIFTSISVQNNDIAPIEIALIPFEKQGDKTFLELTTNTSINFIELTDVSYRNFIATSELTYPSLATKYPLILTGAFRTHNQQTYLDFILKGPFTQWEGLITGNSQQEVTHKLKEHLTQSFIYDLIGKSQPPELKLANLSLAHQEKPHDFITLNQLIEVYIQIDELDKAMVMADKLANIANIESNPLQMGIAFLHQSAILTRKKLYDLSSQKLSLSITQFEKIGDLKRQADAWNAQSWIDHQHDNYDAIKTSLLKSAQLAFDTKDKSREIDALTYLSVMAYKHHQEEDKYLYLQQAENKMRLYQLPIYHFAKVPFHYAIFAKKPADKEPHLKQVLEFTVLTPDHWVAQNSREELMQYYIAQNRLNEAQALIQNLKTDNVYNSFLKTLLAQALQQTDLFITYAHKTFEQAQLAGNKYLSLDTALLLCGTSAEQVNYDFYSQFINENATLNWQRRNKEKLVALNL
ncbi:winged helix-turn-helix domain-containing protein [Pseudoalteromonas denitrificans]|uniref:DNA-binding winged helix-turn-helix (WHTH) domain-containing protein n=1 Tax=Pseudoalteromonas denitrificans DSM 6059 TaxID=1123010 RepID=A0A1I1SPA9_9GAMM|nr:winged helix-turn-helix domain-containing protein [Pseudoalteromonas denitrificans]SFD45723.1 DNA-binding winged helix-turn-helix (wHTH) domain-containing protein [Pseudoalteromonas denitrificans DSM 6059]